MSADDGPSVSGQTDIPDKAALREEEVHGFDLDLNSILISTKDVSVLVGELCNRLFAVFACWTLCIKIN